MNTRKTWKKAGKKSLKKHYWIFITVCLFAAVIGSEYESSLDFMSAGNRIEQAQSQAKSGQEMVNKVKDQGVKDVSAALPSTLDDRLSEYLIADIIRGKQKQAEQKVKQNEKKEAKKKLVG